MDPPDGTVYNPSTIQLILPIEFRGSDAVADLGNDMVAVNCWPLYLIDEVTVQLLGTDKNVTPPKTMSVAEYGLRMLENDLDSEHLTLAQDNLHYCRKKTSLERRSPDSVTPADRTDENLEYRIKNFLAKQVEPKLFYAILLYLITSFRKINNLVSVPIKITITLETNMKRVFENNKKTGDATGVNYSAATYKFHAAPYLFVYNLTPKTMYKTIMKKIFNAFSVYNCGLMEEPTKKIYEMNPGQLLQILNFNGIAKQFNFIAISFKNHDCINHSSIYDSYGGEQATLLIRNIELQNLTESDTYVMLYQDYLAYVCGGSSMKSVLDYKNSRTFTMQPSHTKYLSEGHQIVVDMRQSRGYVSLPDPATRSDSALRVTVTLKVAVKVGVYLTMMAYGFSKGQYKLIKMASGVFIISHFSYTTAP